MILKMNDEIEQWKLGVLEGENKSFGVLEHYRPRAYAGFLLEGET